MLQTWKRETSVFGPTHIVFEQRASDAYELEETAMSATSLVSTEGWTQPSATLLPESRRLDTSDPGEGALLALPLILNELVLASPASSSECFPAERIKEGTEGEGAARPQVEAPTRVQFRQALIEVDDPATFWDGVVGGQVAAVEEQQPLSGTRIFALFEDAVRDLEFSETWLAGYLLGLSDALLKHRKTYPRAYSALLKPFK